LTGTEITFFHFPFSFCFLKTIFGCFSQVIRLYKEGIDNGVVKPLPYQVFQSDQIVEAFRFLGSGKHRGKVLVKVAANAFA